MDRHRLVPLWLLSAVFVINGCQTVCVKEVLSSASLGVPNMPVPMSVSAPSEETLTPAETGGYVCSAMRPVAVHVNEKTGKVIMEPERIRVKTGQCIKWSVVPSDTTITRIKFIDTEADVTDGKMLSTRPIGRQICTQSGRECSVYVALGTGRYFYKMDVVHNGTALSGDPEIEVTCSCP